MAHDTLFAGGWRARLSRTSLGHILPAVAFVVFGTLFVRHISALDGALIWAAITGLSLWQWMLGALFSALSFRAIGTYDVLVHKVMGTGERPRAARTAGIKAIALSQTLGFGAITGALVRWRCLPDLDARKILRLSVVVSLSFLAALAVITGLVVPVSGLFGTGQTAPLLLVGGAALLGLAVLSRIAYRLGWIPTPVGGATLAALLLATAIDTAFAAAALWVLWPEAVSYHLLFSAYLVALGAGLISNAPGGVGAFDLSLLALLPVSDDAAAMAAVLAFRMIYYAAPAAFALIGLLRPADPKGSQTSDHPEAALLMQSARLHRFSSSSLLTLPCWGAGAILGDLPRGVAPTDLTRKDPVALYKCSARQASEARRAGWHVLRCAQDAMIAPQNWTPTGSNFRQLRRALKGFSASGLRIGEVTAMETLSPIATAWTHAHGRERGHSMGQFCPSYLRRQRVFAAYDGAVPLAFVSFHTGKVWTLDLMRHVENLPKGTMQALVVAGIEAARRDCALQLSLAASPAPAANLPFADRALASAAGLHRFKSAFGPTWHPRYICAKGPISLGLTMATLAYYIHFPQVSAVITDDPNPAQKDHEDYSFAPATAPCEALDLAYGAYADDKRPLRPAFHT